MYIYSQFIVRAILYLHMAGSAYKLQVTITKTEHKENESVNGLPSDRLKAYCSCFSSPCTRSNHHILSVLLCSLPDPRSYAG